MIEDSELTELTERQMLYKTYVTTQSLEKRMDSHGKDMRDYVESIHKKIDDRFGKTMEVRERDVGDIMTHIRRVEDKTNRTSAKVATLSAIIALLVSLGTAVAKAFL